jgi:hypothetical protein
VGGRKDTGSKLPTSQWQPYASVPTFWFEQSRKTYVIRVIQTALSTKSVVTTRREASNHKRLQFITHSIFTLVFKVQAIVQRDNSVQSSSLLVSHLKTKSAQGKTKGKGAEQVGYTSKPER